MGMGMGMGIGRGRGEDGLEGDGMMSVEERVLRQLFDEARIMVSLSRVRVTSQSAAIY